MFSNLSRFRLRSCYVPMMSETLQELQAIAVAGGLFTLWRARRDGDTVKVACQCGRRDGARPIWVNSRAWRVDQLADAIDGVARMAADYWRPRDGSRSRN